MTTRPDSISFLMSLSESSTPRGYVHERAPAQSWRRPADAFFPASPPSGQELHGLPPQGHPDLLTREGAEVGRHGAPQPRAQRTPDQPSGADSLRPEILQRERR